MTVAGIRKATSGQNGVGAFILQCKRLEFFYCDISGSSRGMNQFLTNRVAKIAQLNPAIEITVSPRPGKHPVLRGHYINGREKAICVGNMTESQIMNKVEILRDANGERNKRVVKPVKSLNESVRGIWSPYHKPGGGGMHV